MTTGDERTDYERVGADRLPRLIERFVDRMFADWVIGFLFQGKDRDRIVRFELQHAAGVLGGPKEYAGRPLPQVHKPLKINRGHFRRRLAILRTVLREGGVDEDVIERWIGSDRRLEPVLVDGLDCVPDDPAG